MKVMYDFDSQLRAGKVWLVTLDVPDERAEEGNYTVYYYAVANNSRLAEVIANSDYPSATSVTVQKTPVTVDEYAARGNEVPV